MIYLLTFWLISFAHAEDLPDTQVAFRDSCSGKETGLTGPGGSYLSVRVQNLDPDLRLNLKVTWRPAGLAEDLSGDQTREQTVIRVPRGAFGRSIPASGSLALKLSLPSTSWMYQVEQKHQSARIWQADVTWWQAGANPRAGSGIAAIARTLPGARDFFQVLGPRECVWESNSTVSSRPYENRVSDFMNVIRESQNIYHSSWLAGMSIGPNNLTGAPSPMLMNNAITGNNYGWFYKDWQRQLTSEQYFETERKWVLRREDFGVFAKRFGHSRLPVRRWAWEKPVRGCGNWVPQEDGKLDVGIETEDFFVIPRSAYGDPTVTSQNIDLIHPPLNTCREHVGRGPEEATLIQPNGLTGLLYYYPNLRNTP